MLMMKSDPFHFNLKDIKQVYSIDCKLRVEVKE